MSLPFLSTKFYIPPMRADGVSRQRLAEKLLTILALPQGLALVSGPAGFGKTTLLSEFAARLKGMVAWVSLDESDNDPDRFWSYLIAACQLVRPGVGEAAQAMFLSPQSLPAETIPTILINDLASQKDGLVIVLDDFHIIQNPEIHAAVGFLLDHLPDQTHLVLSTRLDPPWSLARLRAHNRLVEVRAKDLRFSREETVAFLQQMGLNLPVEAVAALEERTEGWPAGLQLAGIAMQSLPSLQGGSDVSAFIQAFTGSHVFVAEYLVEEALKAQAESTQTFLLQTSILEHLNAGLCDAITERRDGQAVLMALQRANLFVFPLDDESRWFRYHPLFADLLQARLRQSHSVGAIDRLHRRASGWYEQAGMADEAIRHALAGADLATAVRLIEGHTIEMLVRGYYKKVETWLNAIPPELHFQSPKINMAFVWMHLLRGEHVQITPYLQRLQKVFSESKMGPQDPSEQAEWLTLQSFLAGGQRNSAVGLALARQALEIAPSADSYVCSMAYNALASAHQMAEDYAHAVEACRQAITHGRATTNYFAEMLGFALLVQIALQHGQYQVAFQTASEGIGRVENTGLHSPINALMYGTLGQVLYQRGQIPQAREYLERAIQLGALGGYTDVEIYHRAVFSRLLQMVGDFDASAQEIEKAAVLALDASTDWAREEVVSQQIRIYLAQNRLRAAEATLRSRGFGSQGRFSIPEIDPERTIDYQLGLLYNSALRILLHQAKDSPADVDLRRAVDLAENLVSRALQGQYLTIALESLLLRACLHAALGEDQACLEAVAQALEVAEPEGIVSSFVEEGVVIEAALSTLLSQNRLGKVQTTYVESILVAFLNFPSSGGLSPEKPQPSVERPLASEAEATSLVDPLSRRELEVLRLIGEGCSNHEIAGQLVLSLHTVKKHISNIFMKLGVKNRTQAVAAARKLKLL